MDDVTLITLVENQEILYDKKRSDYKDRNKQCVAWQNIANCMGVEVEIVKSRWLCLRQRFSRERSKLASGADASDEWELLKYMRFLDPVVAVRKTMFNYKKARQAECSEVENPPKTCDPLEVYVDDDAYRTMSRASVEIFSPASSEMDDVATPSTSSAKPKKRSSKLSTEEPPQKKMPTTLQISVQGVNALMANKQGPTADSDDIFGQFVASRLKLLDDAEKKEKMKEIFNILMS